MNSEEMIRLLLEGKFFDFMLLPYSQLGTELLFGIFLTTLIGIIYIRTRSLELTTVSIMLSFAIIPLIFPKLKVFLLLAIALGFAYAVYSLFWKRYWGER